MTLAPSTRSALALALPLISLPSCRTVDQMAERQKSVGLRVESYLTPGVRYPKIVSSIVVTPLRADRHYLLQVSSGNKDGDSFQLHHVGSWSFDVTKESVGRPVMFDLTHWHPSELTRERRAFETPLPAQPNEINAERGGNSLWVCEMSRNISADGTGARDIFNTTWFWLEGPK